MSSAAEITAESASLDNHRLPALFSRFFVVLVANFGGLNFFAFEVPHGLFGMIDFRFEAFPEALKRTHPVFVAGLDIIETVFDLCGVFDFHDAGKALD